MPPQFGLGLAAAFAGGIAYGSNAPFATLADRMGVSGADAVLWRALLMTALCLALARLARRPLALTVKARRDVLSLGVATAATSIAYLSSVAYVPVAVAAVVFYTFPIVILITGPLVDGEPITKARLGVFATGFLGVVLVVGAAIGGLDLRGLILAGIASAGAAAMMFAGQRATRHVAPEAVGFWVHVLVVPAALVVTFAIGGPARLPAEWAFAGVFAVIAGSYVAGFLLQLAALRRIPPVVAGFVFLIEPVVAILTAAAVLGERLDAVQYVGCAVVLASLVASVLVEKREMARRAGKVAT